MTTYDAAVSYDEPITYDHFTAVVSLSGSTSASSERLSAARTALVGSSTSQGSIQRLTRRSRGRSVGSSSIHALAPRISKAGSGSTSGALPSKSVSKGPFVGSSVASGAVLKRAGIAISAIASAASEATLFLTTSYVGLLEPVSSLSKRLVKSFQSSSSLSGTLPSKRVSKSGLAGSSVMSGALLKRAGIAISSVTSSFSEATLFLTTSYVGVLEAFKSLSKRPSIDFESSTSFSGYIYKNTMKIFSSAAFSSTEQAKSVSKGMSSSVDVFGNRSTFISRAFTSVLTAFTDVSKTRVNISKGMNVRSYITNKYRLHTNDVDTKYHLHTNQNYELEN